MHSYNNLFWADTANENKAKMGKISLLDMDLKVVSLCEFEDSRWAKTIWEKKTNVSAPLMLQDGYKRNQEKEKEIFYWAHFTYIYHQASQSDKMARYHSLNKKK